MKSRYARAVLAAAFLFGVCASTAASQERRDPLCNEVLRAIERYPQFTIFDDINVSIEQGVATLTGKVTMPHKKQDVERLAARVEGIRSVRNTIEVLPVSASDDDLRYRVSKAIYGNPSFWSYAAMANPPIHIIVEHGRVTLTGVVQTNVERMLARSLATGLGEISLTDALRTEVTAPKGSGSKLR